MFWSSAIRDIYAASGVSDSEKALRCAAWMIRYMQAKTYRCVSRVGGCAMAGGIFLCVR